MAQTATIASSNAGTTDNTGVSNYYNALQAAAMSAVGSQIQGNLTPIQAGAQGDFAYNYLNASLLFNAWTFDYISTLAQSGDYPGAAKLAPADSFPQSTLQLVNQIIFSLSAADQQALTNAQNNAQTQQLNVVQTYTGLYGQITPAMIATAAAGNWLSPIPSQQTPFNYILNYVVGGVWAGKATAPGLSLTVMRTAPSLSNLLPNTPGDGTPVVGAVTAYLNAIGPVTSLMDQQSYGNYMINLVKQALLAPTVGVGGMTIADPTGVNPNTVVPQYGINRSVAQIQNDLASANTISMGLAVSQSSSSTTNVSINEGSSFTIGGPIVSATVSQSASYDMTSMKGSGTSCNISIAYKGYSVIPIAPQALMTGSTGATGWYFPTMISEAYTNWQAGSAATTGFNFQNSPVLNLAQYPSGAFNTLSTLLISAYPTITINYTAGSYSDFTSVFTTQTSATVKLFGFIPIGGASMSTYNAVVTQGSSNSNFSVTFNPPSTTGVSMAQQTATVLGGVIVSPAKQTVSSVVSLMMAATVL